VKSIDFTNNDLNIVSKRLQIVTDTAQKIQKTKSSLLIVFGELFYNADIGLDYTKVLDVTEKNISDEYKKLAIIEAIMKDSNVEKVDNIVIETDKISRKQSITVQLKYKDETETTTIGGVTVG
jgi:hypothetical protein